VANDGRVQERAKDLREPPVSFPGPDSRRRHKTKKSRKSGGSKNTKSGKSYGKSFCKSAPP
jgi:hypothetical protein